MRVYEFTVVIERDEDAFHAYVPALPGCYSFGATVEEAQANIQEAAALHIESMLADGESPLAETPLDLRRDKSSARPACHPVFRRPGTPCSPRGDAT